MPLLLLALLPAAAGRRLHQNAAASSAPPPPLPPGKLPLPLLGKSVCVSAECQLHRTVLAVAALLAVSGAANVLLFAWLLYQRRRCRSWCVQLCGACGGCC